MAKQWDISIDVDRTAATSLNTQLLAALTDRIRSGLLRPGDALPGTRELALRLGVNRKTLDLVYDELIAQGWLVSHEKSGTFVSPELPVFRQEQRVAAVARRLSGRLAEPGYQPYGDDRPLMTALGDDATDFSDGAPDTRLIPFEDLSRGFPGRASGVCPGQPDGLRRPAWLKHLAT